MPRHMVPNRNSSVNSSLGKLYDPCLLHRQVPDLPPAHDVEAHRHRRIAGTRSSRRALWQETPGFSRCESLPAPPVPRLIRGDEQEVAGRTFALQRSQSGPVVPLRLGAGLHRAVRSQCQAAEVSGDRRRVVRRIWRRRGWVWWLAPSFRTNRNGITLWPELDLPVSILLKILKFPPRSFGFTIPILQPA